MVHRLTRSHCPRRNPDAIVLRLHSDVAWCHPSESYFLTLDPTYTYHPNEKNALNRLKPFPRRTSKDQTDLFYFDANDEVWKYHGIFVYVGSQTMTFRQAREKLKISEAVSTFNHKPEVPMYWRTIQLSYFPSHSNLWSVRSPNPIVNGSTRCAKRVYSRLPALVSDEWQ